jgi:hypothetical protein
MSRNNDKRNPARALTTQAIAAPTMTAISAPIEELQADYQLIRAEMTITQEIHHQQQWQQHQPQQHQQQQE